MSFPIRRLEHGARRLPFVLLLATGIACGSAAERDPAEEPPSPGPGAAPSPAAADEPAPSDGRGEAAASVAAVIGQADDQLRAACGATLDACEAAAGCDDILACAARSACSGVACYCADPSCASPGPCRVVIDGAPGARTPDSANPSLGPAADAAAAVGACLQGLAGGVPGPAPSPGVPVPDPPEAAPLDAGASAPDAG